MYVHFKEGKNEKAHITTDNTSICYLKMNSHMAPDPLRGEPRVQIFRGKLPKSES